MMKSSHMKPLNERREMVGLITIIVALSFVVLGTLTGWMILYLPVWAAVIFYVIWHLLYWRCPHCQKMLHARGLGLEKVEFCPRCGGKVDEPPQKT